jgi:hypothetical protein
MRLLRTWSVMVPLIEVINTTLPLLPNHTICLPATCAVNITLFLLTPIA